MVSPQPPPLQKPGSNPAGDVLISTLTILVGATARFLAQFGQGTADQPIAMDNVACDSSESYLASCNYLNANATRSCTHQEDAGVVCLQRKIVSPGTKYFQVGGWI